VTPAGPAQDTEVRTGSDKLPAAGVGSTRRPCLRREHMHYGGRHGSAHSGHAGYPQHH